jgi:hypothetical protein
VNEANQHERRVPLKSILDSSFKYTPSCETDVRKTFARVRLEQQAQISGEDEHAASVAELIVHRPAQPTDQ